MNNKKISKITPIDWIDEVDRWIVVPGTIKEGRKKRIREIPFSKNNCYFARGVPKGIIDFAYRAVTKLKLSDRTFIFSRGTVRNPRSRMKYNVSVRELDWGVGTLITIPRMLRYREEKTVFIGDCTYRVNVMRSIILITLLAVAFPEKNSYFHFAMAVMVLTRGWDQLRVQEPPRIYRG